MESADQVAHERKVHQVVFNNISRETAVVKLDTKLLPAPMVIEISPKERKRRQKIKRKETNGEIARQRDNLKLSRTPEELAGIRLKKAEYDRLRRQHKRYEIVAKEFLERMNEEKKRDDEKAAKRRARKAENSRIRRQKKKEENSETPEQIALRRAKANARQRIRRIHMLRKETPDQKAVRVAKATEIARKRREQLKLLLTPEEFDAVRNKKAAIERNRRRQKRFQIAAEKLIDNTPVQVKFESTDETLTGSCSWSSIETSEHSPLSCCSLDPLEVSFLSDSVSQTFESGEFYGKLTAVVAPVVQSIIVKEEIDL